MSCLLVKKPVMTWEEESYRRGAVLRYWGCNLRCWLCFAQSYSYRDEEKFRKKRRVSLERLRKELMYIKDRSWFRIEGGEPLLNYERMIFTADIISRILSVNKKARIIVQTNGVWLGLSFKNTKAFIEKIIEVLNKNKSCRIAIEVSFKGANANDTAIYAGVKNVQGNPILNLQCCAFKYLRDLLKKTMG